MLLSWTLGISGCNLLPDKPEPIDFPSTFSEIQPIDKEVVSPTPLPLLPVAVCLPSPQDCTYVGFDSNGFTELEIYGVIASSNYEVATYNANAARHAITGYNELILAGRSQETVTQIREEQLQLERKESAYDIFWHRVLIIGMIVIIVAI